MIKKTEQSVYASPKSRILNPAKDNELASDGQCVVTRAEISWPSRCYRCNDKASQSLQVKVFYVAWWLPVLGIALFYAYLLLVGGVIVPLVVWFGLQWWVPKKARLSVFICTRHNIQRQRLLWARWGVLLFFVASIGSMLYAQNVYTLALIILSLALALGVTVLVLLSGNLYASVRRYQDGLFWIKGTGQAFRDSLPPFR